MAETHDTAPASAHIGDDYGITPEVQGKFNEASELIRRAISLIEGMIIDEDSDAWHRAGDALEGLEMARAAVEWTPPRDVCS